MTHFALFDTAIGRAGLAWSARGLVAVQLPESSEAATRDRLRRRAPAAVEAAPTPDIHRAMADLTALLAGERRDLSWIPLDAAGVPHFHQRVYEVTRTIAPGQTLTYGDIATRLAAPGSARAVGQALGHNPWPLVVPCHRVLGAGNTMVGFSAHGGAVLKRRLLGIEGARLSDALSLFGD
ncbi:MAG: methylated-DNA--[protein]-cysteine S-methyltransferase [Gemmatimonadales bacterium]